MAAASGLTVLLSLVCAMLLAASAGLLASPKPRAAPYIFLMTASLILALLIAGVHASGPKGTACRGLPRPAARTRTEPFEVSTDESESLQGAILQDVCLYLSTLGTKGLVDNRWRNLGPSGAARDFVFEASPSLQASTRALRVLNNPATGPESQFLGVRGEDNFTIAWHGAFPRLAGSGVPFRHTLMEYYANTHTNVGVRVEVEATPMPGTAGSETASGPLEFAIVYTQGRRDMPPFVARWPIREVLAAPMTYAVSRDQGTVCLWIAGVKDFKEAGGAPVEPVLLSNRRARINPSGTLDADLEVLALYARACDRQFVEALDGYIRKRKSAISDATQSLVKEKQSADQRKACPLLDKKVCATECSTIRDWTNPFDVMSSASIACKDKLVDYCMVFDSSKPENVCQGCFLTPAKDTDRCRNLRSFLETKQPVPASAALAAITGSSIVERMRNDLVAGEPDLKRWFTSLVVPAAPGRDEAMQGQVASFQQGATGVFGPATGNSATVRSLAATIPTTAAGAEQGFISVREASGHSKGRAPFKEHANTAPAHAAASANNSAVLHMVNARAGPL